MKFYLEEPTLERENDVIDYLNEFGSNSAVNGASLFENILYGESYEDCLEKVKKLVDKDYAKSINRLPSKTFFFTREDDDKIIGLLNIRYDFDAASDKFRGHIGYSIRPTERRKGYNKINLYLGLKKAKHLGLKKVKLSCEATNIGSNKTIEALGGMREISAVDPSDNELTNVYWIDIEYSLNKYREYYEKYI